MRVLRRIRIGIEVVLIMAAIWLPMLAGWWQILVWIEGGRQQASRSGINVDPDGILLFGPPLFMLMVAYHVARAVVRRLERYWSRLG